MAYIRWSEDCDIYLTGTTDDEGTGLAECCGCKLTRSGPWPHDTPEPRLGPDDPGGYTWQLEPNPQFSTHEAVRAHLEQHARAGHKVPARAYSCTENDTWMGSKQL